MSEALRRPVLFMHEFLWAITMPIGARPFAERALEAAAIRDSDHLVDVGCGPGTTARLAARKAARVTGVDPTPAMLSLAKSLTRSKIRHRISWRAGVAEALPVDDRTATVVTAIRAAHHFDDQHAAIDEFRRVLSTGGRLVVVERSVRPKRGGGHGHGLTFEHANELAEKLKAAGFEQVKVARRRLRLGRAVVVSATRA